ncbi:nitrite reductase [Sporomusa sp.]|uniref:nitrite reductase n=1 Tax=Sporomusa sp. TaxID=2078658 RepID=UPI002BBAD054|nr:nitrite reductase [Sporomusa sp.]HWR42032.1 nitrite reductase [Sporomusa sp.]
MSRPTNVPLAPRLPAGLATPALLRQLAAIAEKYDGSIKISGNTILILGLNPENRAQALAELGGNSQSLSAKAVRGVAVCAGKPHCPRAVQDSTALGLALDNKFYGTELPGKLRMGVSGCPNCCAESFVKDIGLYGVAHGYTLVVGGNSGRQAQPGRIVAQKIPPEAVLPCVNKILDYYRTYGHAGERLGQTVSRLGFEDFAAYIGVD